MQCLITALTRSFIEKTKKKKTNKSKNKNFTAKTKYLNMNATSNNYTADQTIQQMAIFHNETR